MASFRRALIAGMVACACAVVLAAPPPPPAKAVFKMGASQQAVLQILGMPSNISQTDSDGKQIWYYKKAQVNFVNGIVVGWRDFLEKSPEHSANAAPLHLGATSEEVFAAFGFPPTALHYLNPRKRVAGEEEWKYSIGAIIFQNNHIVGWRNLNTTAISLGTAKEGAPAVDIGATAQAVIDYAGTPPTLTSYTGTDEQCWTYPDGQLVLRGGKLVRIDVAPPAPAPAAAPGMVDKGITPELEARAENAPDEVATSVAALAAYLTLPAQTEAQKARVLFHWETTHINYNAAGFFSTQLGDNNPETVLKDRTGVCSGYAFLYAALARAAGLKSEVVFGKTRTPTATPGQCEEGNHAWSAIQINGQWQLLDPTFASGSIDENKQFVRKLNEHFYLTPPGEMILDHFPTDARQQLLEKPFSLEEFQNLPVVSSGYFNSGLQIDSHPNLVVPMVRDLVLTLQGPADASLVTRVYQGGQPLPISTSFVQRENDKFVVRVTAPSAGTYTLMIFTASPTEPGKYECALEYRLEATEGAGEQSGYPIAFDNFYKRQARLIAPFDHFVPGNVAGSFDLILPGALDATIRTRYGQMHLNKQGNRFSGSTQLPLGPVQILAKYPGETPAQANTAVVSKGIRQLTLPAPRVDNYEVLLQFTAK